MLKNSRVKSMNVLVFSFLCLALVVNMSAQTTAFTYQGSLKNSGSPANGNCDLEIKLFDAASSGTQIGSTLQRLNVPVANGIFTVSLDFGAAAFPGADRYIEIGVRVNGNPGGFQQLLPRQQITSTPYANRSLNSTAADTATNATNSDQLGGVAANQYVVTTDPRLTDARNPTAGSANYIQNQNAVTQASSNFNISGTGTASIINAATQYNIGGNRIFTANGSFSFGANIFTATNTFAGDMAGINTSPDPAPASTTGKFNSFYGAAAGKSNSTGYGNSFFGGQAGSLNMTGTFNSFFGLQTGYSTTLGSYNSFFGAQAGYNNSFFGGNNSFFGSNAGYNNTSGSNNTIVGTNADVLSNSLTNAGAFGYQAAVGSSNSLVLGSINGVNGATANTKVGIGTTTPLSALQIQDGGTNAAHVRIGGDVIGSDTKIITFGDWGCGGGAPCVYIGEIGQDDLLEFRASIFNFVVGVVKIDNLASAGATALCRNASNQIATCSSSLRYKTNISPFASGLSFVNKLRPISFDWKDGGMKDVGFGAEDIEEIDPRFVTYNDKGEVEGVKYDRISTVLVNAVKEQQEQIETLQKTNSQQQQQIEELKAVVCSIKADAEICKAKKE